MPLCWSTPDLCWKWLPVETDQCHSPLPHWNLHISLGMKFDSFVILPGLGFSWFMLWQHIGFCLVDLHQLYHSWIGPIKMTCLIYAFALNASLSNKRLPQWNPMVLIFSGILRTWGKVHHLFHRESLHYVHKVSLSFCMFRRWIVQNGNLHVHANVV